MTADLSLLLHAARKLDASDPTLAFALREYAVRLRATMDPCVLSGEVVDFFSALDGPNGKITALVDGVKCETVPWYAIRWPAPAPAAPSSEDA
jgi:hypothetical protein